MYFPRAWSLDLCAIFAPTSLLQATDLATFTLETLFQNLNFAVKIFRYLMDPCVHLTLMQIKHFERNLLVVTVFDINLLLPFFPKRLPMEYASQTLEALRIIFHLGICFRDRCPRGFE